MQQESRKNLLDANTYEANKFTRLAQESKEALDEALATGNKDKARVHQADLRFYTRKVERILRDQDS